MRHYGQKYEFLSEIAYPLLDRKVKLRPNFFHGYLSWDSLYQCQSFNKIWVLHLGYFPCKTDFIFDNYMIHREKCRVKSTTVYFSQYT